MFVSEIIPVLGPHLVLKGAGTSTGHNQSVMYKSHTLTHTHTFAHGHTHHIPGFILRPPLHIMIFILHLDEPVPKDGRGVIDVVICRHPVGG